MGTVTDLVTSMETEIQTELGAGYKKLAYLENVEQNSFRTSSERYGVRALASSQVPGVTKFATYDQSFEVVLTKSYQQSNIDDTEKVQAGLDLRDLILGVFTRLVNTKAGLPAVVMHTNDLAQAEMEYLDDDKVAVLRSTLTITYRITLL